MDEQMQKMFERVVERAKVEITDGDFSLHTIPFIVADVKKVIDSIGINIAKGIENLETVKIPDFGRFVCNRPFVLKDTENIKIPNYIKTDKNEFPKV
jgi:nucleoid DNA-binding protein